MPHNVAIGLEAMGGEYADRGYGNVAIGFGALRSLTTGSYNVAIGTDALADVTDESYQIQIGAVRLAGDDPDLAQHLSDALWAWLREPRGPLFGVPA